MNSVRKMKNLRLKSGIWQVWRRVNVNIEAGVPQTNKWISAGINFLTFRRSRSVFVATSFDFCCCCQMLVSLIENVLKSNIEMQIGRK